MAASSPTQKNVWDWAARIHSSQSELQSSYNVIIFIGTVPDNPEEWLVCPQFVGKHTVLTKGSIYGRKSKTDMTEGFVHLSQAIAARSGLSSLEPEEVVPYLTNALNWRIQKLDGSHTECKSLKVVVFATPLSYPPGEQFPVPASRRGYKVQWYHVWTSGWKPGRMKET